MANKDQIIKDGIVLEVVSCIDCTDLFYEDVKSPAFNSARCPDCEAEPRIKFKRGARR
jgi:NAD-dependent SIR2 family protein deacetylase